MQMGEAFFYQNILYNSFLINCLQKIEDNLNFGPTLLINLFGFNNFKTRIGISAGQAQK